MLSRLRITPETWVVTDSAPLGFWLLRAHGHEDVRMLMGPRGQWAQVGHEWSTDAPAVAESAHPPVVANDDLSVSREAVRGAARARRACRARVRRRAVLALGGHGGCRPDQSRPGRCQRSDRLAARRGWDAERCRRVAGGTIAMAVALGDDPGAIAPGWRPPVAVLPRLGRAGRRLARSAGRDAGPVLLRRQSCLPPCWPAACYLRRSAPASQFRAVRMLAEVDRSRAAREKNVTGQGDALGARGPSVPAALELGAQVEQVGIAGLNGQPRVGGRYGSHSSG